jgi:hypothetical protein
MRSVAIVFIGTNRYLDFLPSYYEQCDELLMPDCKKQYFVFTDGDLEGTPDDISVYNIEHKPWPSITLERFHTILEAEEELKSYDWLLFLDADMRVNKKIFSNEILDPEKDFVAVHHPCHYNDYSGTFETNPASTACVPDKEKAYYQGCLWGGKVSAVIPMMKELKKRVDTDYSNDIIALWHDESHLNKFFSENKDRVNDLSPDYAFPECFPQYPYDRKIIHLAKNNSEYQT